MRKFSLYGNNKVSKRTAAQPLLVRLWGDDQIFGAHIAIPVVKAQLVGAGRSRPTQINRMLVRPSLYTDHILIN
jgi:hypothetical protein